MNTNWKGWHTFLMLALLLGISFLARCLSENPLKIWSVFILGFVAFLAIAGKGIVGCWTGALIDDRNVISLSRFQMVAWTILILSALGAAVLWNVQHGTLSDTNKTSCLANSKQGCFPSLPEMLWLLMGISTASLVGSPLILNAKKTQESNIETDRTFELLTPAANFNRQLATNAEPSEARWSDLFTGEERGNCARLDFSRLQMFFFTLVSLLTYGVSIADSLSKTMQSAAFFETLPGLSEGLLALIGISHTGYLAAKASQNTLSTGASSSTREQAVNTAENDIQAIG